MTATTQRVAGSRERVPGDVLLHPVSLGALAVLLVNDHFLKDAAPGTVTGKVSDAAGLVFFPLLLLALTEATRKVAGVRDWTLAPAVLLGLVALTVVGFTAVKMSPAIADAYSQALGCIAWPVKAALSGATAPEPIRVLADPTDLLALPAVFAAFYVGKAVILEQGAASE